MTPQHSSKSGWKAWFFHRTQKVWSMGWCGQLSYRDQLAVFPYNNQMFSLTGHSQPSGSGALRIKGKMVHLALDLRAISLPWNFCGHWDVSVWGILWPSGPIFPMLLPVLNFGLVFHQTTFSCILQPVFWLANLYDQLSVLTHSKPDLDKLPYLPRLSGFCPRLISPSI